MYQIKLCPFCGGRPYLEGHTRAFINGETTKVAFVRCTQCSARSGRFNLADFGKSSWSIDACKAAVEAWNSRAQDTEETILFEPTNERRVKRKREKDAVNIDELVQRVHPA